MDIVEIDSLEAQPRERTVKRCDYGRVIFSGYVNLFPLFPR
jgi:hypothetical protein